MLLPALPKALDLWLPAWLRRPRVTPTALGARHLLLCVCDEFEPRRGGADPEKGLRRINAWVNEFPRLCHEFRDSKGQHPRQTFFYPVEQYDPALVQPLAGLCHLTGSEVEISLHHENATAAETRQLLLQAKDQLASHGLLSRDDVGHLRYGFLHGQGALDNSHPEGRHCGVSGELAILRETGCFADFTLPTAPARTQTEQINSLYYARSRSTPKSHNRGRRVVSDRKHAPPSADELLLVQGPLALNWGRRSWGLLPTIETGALTAANPPTLQRLQLWADCAITVAGRPSWIFIKLRTRGAVAANARMLLGEPMRAFHRELAELASEDPTLHYHYVTAREMVNILHAAEAGHSGDPSRFRDYRYRPVSQLEEAPAQEHENDPAPPTETAAQS